MKSSTLKVTCAKLARNTLANAKTHTKTTGVLRLVVKSDTYVSYPTAIPRRTMSFNSAQSVASCDRTLKTSISTLVKQSILSAPIRTFFSVNLKPFGFTKVNGVSEAQALDVMNRAVTSLDSDPLRGLLKAFGSAEDTIMSRQAVLEHVVDRALSEAIEAVGLYADADATSNNGSTAQQQQQQPVDKVAEFKTTYWQLAVQDSTGRLKAARIRQWAAVMEHGFGVPESEVAKAEITVEQAREITQLWAEYTDHEHFVNALDERFKRLHNYDEDPNAPAMAKAFSRSARTQALRDVLSQALMQLFKDYGYEGEKGFMLMQKALQEHYLDMEVAHAHNTASIRALVQSGLYDGPPEGSVPPPPPANS